jgi:signal transduction histidine kinase
VSRDLTRPLSPWTGAQQAAETGISRSAWRALAVFRGLTLLYAIIASLVMLPPPGRRVWVLAILATMALWSAVATTLYARPWLRRWPLLAVDMAVTIAAILGTLLVKTPAELGTGGMTVPSVWAATAALAWALRWRIAGGLWAATAIAAANIAVDRGRPTAATIHALVLVYLAAAVIGYVMRIAERAENTLSDAIRLQAANAERERLSREIHDGVLQVLAMIRRSGTALGADAAELGRLASEQEAALRALVSAGPSVEHHGGLADLRELLAGSARSPHVQLVTPAGPVLLPAMVAGQLASAVSAALHNVKQHVAAGADAWVLVEATAAEVTVTVRDDGPGIPSGRLDAAAAEGRLGVSQSIVGRIRDLGGTVTITSAPGEGTEVELRVPR